MRSDPLDELLPYEEPEPVAYDVGRLSHDNGRLMGLLVHAKQLLESGRPYVALEMLRREVGR